MVIHIIHILKDEIFTFECGFFVHNFELKNVEFYYIFTLFLKTYPHYPHYPQCSKFSSGALRGYLQI